MRFRTILLIALVTIPVLPLSAHPHVWIDTKAEVVIKNGVVEGFWAVWTFDEIFSNILSLDYDHDQDGQFDQAESSELQKDYFDNLKNYHYFTYVYWNGKSLNIPRITQFRATLLDGKKAVYRFFVPIGQKLTTQSDLVLAMYDETFFTDMVFQEKDPVQFTIQGPGKAKVKIGENKARAYYGGQVYPVEARIKWEAP